MRRPLVSVAVLVFGVGCSRSTASPAGGAAASSASASAGVDDPTTPIPPASVDAYRNPMRLPEYTGPTGSVEGTITITGDPPPDVTDKDFHKCPAARAVYGKLFRAGAPLADGSRPLADALVAVIGYQGYYVPEHRPSRLVTIQNCAFDTRTVDMTIGQPLEVANKDREMFGPALSQAPTYALMVAPPGGDPVRLYPTKPAYYTLIDKLGHDYMTADVYALMYPLHAVSGLDGHYRIDGVPVGTMRLDGRLPAIKQTTGKQVTVQENAVTHLDLQFTYNAGQAPPPTSSSRPWPPRTP